MGQVLTTIGVLTVLAAFGTYCFYIGYERGGEKEYRRGWKDCCRFFRYQEDEDDRSTETR